MTATILEGDALGRLREMPDESVQCCVTSPPYFGLRDYRVEGQIGLEASPDEFVAALVVVFREVRRVLRSDGTLWLNIGDSYNADGRKGRAEMGKGKNAGYSAWVNKTAGGTKPKDLLLIPSLLAAGLRAPYYTGKIRDERERIWLAAMIDGEGCIHIHRRREGQANGNGYRRKADSFGPALEVANTSLAVVERCKTLTGMGTILRQEKDRRQPLYRWTVRTRECRDLLREVYPHLVAKQHEARIAVGCPSSGEHAAAAWEALKLLHGGSATTVDFPEPQSCFEPGWYLRSEIIWSKPNPMPESVTDRPTSAHEKLFLLSKRADYFYDQDAIREPHTEESLARARRNRFGGKYADADPAQHGALKAGNGFGPDGDPDIICSPGGRNKRNVWEVATQGFPEAHFATFPAKLVEPCVLAGSSPQACGVCGAPWQRLVDVEYENPGGRTTNGPRSVERRHLEHGSAGFAQRLERRSTTIGWTRSCTHADDDSRRCVVLDPFAGSGTVGVVCEWHGRDFIGIELNPEFAEMARRRIATEGPLRRAARRPRELDAAQLGLLD